jgi:transposase-like protein
VHFLRNLLARVPKGNAEMVAAAVRTIFAQPDDQHVHAQLDVISGMLGKQFPIVEVMLQEAADDLLAFAAFPVGHWKKIWSANPLEAGQQGDQTPHRRRRRLPQPRSATPPRRRRPGRDPRRMGRHRPALPIPSTP